MNLLFTSRENPDRLALTGIEPRGRLERLAESNEVPSDKEHLEIGYMLNLWRKELSAFDHHPQGRTFSPERRAMLFDAISRYEPILSVIRRLPPEIISTIQRSSTESQADHPLWLHRPSYSSCNVSRYWRAVALSNAQLWSTIIVDFTLTGSRLKDLSIYVETFLSRSAASYLAIGIYGLASVKTCRPVLSHLIANSMRWRRLCLKVDVEAIHLLNDIHNHLESLAQLTILVSSPIATQISECKLFDNAPQLTSFHCIPSLKGFHLAFKIPPENLKELNYHGFTGQAEGTDFLRRISGVQDLHTGWRWSGVEQLHNPIVLPLLERLQLRPGWFDRSDDDILDHLVTPSLTQIKVWGRGLQRVLPRVASLVSRSPACNLTDFRTGSRIIIEPGELVKFLKLVTSITQLEISFPHIHDLDTISDLDKAIAPNLSHCRFLFHSERPLTKLQAIVINSFARRRCDVGFPADASDNGHRRRRTCLFLRFSDRVSQKSAFDLLQLPIIYFTSKVNEVGNALIVEKLSQWKGEIQKAVPWFCAMKQKNSHFSGIRNVSTAVLNMRKLDSALLQLEAFDVGSAAPLYKTSIHLVVYLLAHEAELTGTKEFCSRIRDRARGILKKWDKFLRADLSHYRWCFHNSMELCYVAKRHRPSRRVHPVSHERIIYGAARREWII